MFIRRIFGMCLATLICAVGTIGPVAAETFPTRPIKLIVPQPPGGPGDIFARLIARQLSATLGQPVIVDNRPGGALMIGTKDVATATPDGYTLLFAPPGPLTVRPAIAQNLGYDPVKSFAPVALVASSPQILVVSATVPVHSVRELVAYARDNPGKVNLGIPGVGTQPHLIGEMFKQRTGVSIVTVPYKGSAAVTDLVAGRVQMYFGPAQDLLAFFSTGKLRPLAVLSSTRRAELPDVPTMAEAGYDGFDVSLWVGIVAPAGTPASIVARLNAAVNAGLASAEVRAHLAELQADARPGTPEDFADFIAAEARKWTDVAKTAGIVIN